MIEATGVFLRREGFLVLSLLCWLCSCVQSGGPSTSRELERTRLAEAQMKPFNAGAVLGELRFEQMPNSMIVSYRWESLNPKTSYEIRILKNSDCERPSLKASQSLFQFRSSASPLSENTFRLEDFTVSKDNPKSVLHRHFVLSTSAPASVVACGRAEPVLRFSETPENLNNP